jgi:hypothetical protein
MLLTISTSKNSHLAFTVIEPVPAASVGGVQKDQT